MVSYEVRYLLLQSDVFIWPSNNSEQNRLMNAARLLSGQKLNKKQAKNGHGHRVVTG